MFPFISLFSVLKDGLRVFIGAVGSWYWQGKFIQLFSYFDDYRKSNQVFLSSTQLFNNSIGCASIVNILKN